MAMSPMMQEYCKTKEQYKDCILFYRLGDFYEMFFDDALLVTRELEITLTGKDCGLEERAPMCGVPYHAAETYINRLIERGHKVAICEQVEDPKKAKGLVKREVVRIVTPGTTLDAAALDETKNNYLMSIVSMEEHFGCAIADITTGDCFLTEVDKPQKLLDEINKFVPAEIICNDSFYMSNIDTDDLQNRLGICVFSLDSWYFDDELCRRTLKEHFHVGSLEGLGVGDYDCGIIAAGALFLYLKETQKTALSHMTTIRPYAAEKYMLIDSSSRRNLELVETLREKQKRGSLLWVLDKTKTAMGARTLRSYVEQPLIDRDEIEERLEALEELNKNGIALAIKTGKAMKEIPFDLCFTSPLKRARHTAQLVLGDRKDVPVIEDVRLREISFGEWEGKDSRLLPAEMLDNFFHHTEAYQPPKNAESLESICKRTQEFYEELIQKEELQDKTILIASHGCAVRALLQNVYENPSIENFWRGCVPPNCSVNIIEVKNKISKLIEEDKIF